MALSWNEIKERAIKFSKVPMLFGEIRQPKSDYILIPRVSSENRNIISMDIFPPDFIVGDTCLAIQNASLYHLGVLQSNMHMAWVKTVCGRLESRFRYSNEIVYNNFPWPENITPKQVQKIEDKMKVILDLRKLYPNVSRGKLYDIGETPPALVKAHNELDKAVDMAYRPQPFVNDANRMEFLFELYEKYTADLFTKEKIKRIKKVISNK